VNIQQVEHSKASAGASGHLKHFDSVPGLVWAFRIHDDGAAEQLPIDQPIPVRPEGWIWLHLDLANTAARQWITALDLPQAGIMTLRSRDRHQQLHVTDALVHGVVADMEKGIDGIGDDVGHLRFVMTDRMLISGRHRKLASVASARIALEGGRRLTHVASLLELIIEQVADGIDRIAENLAGEMDRIENGLAEGSNSVERSKLTLARRSSVRLHRQVSSLRAVFHRLERQGLDGLKPGLQLAVSRLAQRLDDLDHGILELRERGHRLQDEMTSLMAEETNRHLYVLSILTTLLLPPTLVTGVFGMNTKGLPLTDAETGFLWAMALMISSAGAAYLIMRRIGVFKL
jgi:zinc transporter